MTTETTNRSSARDLPPSTLRAMVQIQLVGGIGIAVQFAALFLLKSVLHFNYLAATAIAVEAAVVHNFVWHEQFTWADRTKADRSRTCVAPLAAQALALQSHQRRSLDPRQPRADECDGRPRPHELSTRECARHCSLLAGKFSGQRNLGVRVKE